MMKNTNKLIEICRNNKVKSPNEVANLLYNLGYKNLTSEEIIKISGGI